MSARERARRIGVALAAEALLREAAERLLRAGIEVMPLKGVLLARWVYRDPEERPLTDVDLLLRPRDRRRARAALRPLGPVWAHNSASFTLRAERFGIDLDVHHRLFPAGLFRLPTEPLFARSSDGAALFGQPLRLPDPLDLYAHLIGHLAKGRELPPREDHLRDLAEVPARLELDALRAADRLSAGGLGRAARAVLGLARERGDRFAGEVLAALPRDRVGGGLAWAARRAFARDPGSLLSVIAAHGLNRSLPAGLGSLLLHGLEAGRARLRGAEGGP